MYGTEKTVVNQAHTLEEQLAYDGLQAAMRLAHGTAQACGWYNDPATGAPIKRNFGEVLALMHSELSEALEADRTGTMDDKLPHRPGVECEFADCLLRIFDTAAALGLDLAGALIEKNRFNARRADHKLENRAVAGGKRY
jgi:NTP pyrophosphatase (non-canonical NTP hydrolase)